MSNWTRWAVGGVAILAAGFAPARDLWLVVAGDAPAFRAEVNFGESDHRELPLVQRLLDLNLVTETGTVPLREGNLEVQPNGERPTLLSDRFTLPGGAAVLTARYDDGYWVKTPGGYRNVSKRLYPAATDSRWTVHFAKTLLGPGANKLLIGHEFELMALDDPFALKPGQALRVQVLLRGMPVADAEVRSEDGVRLVPAQELRSYRTSADGIATVPIDRRGPFVLGVVFETEGLNPELAAKDQYTATLAFALH